MTRWLNLKTILASYLILAITYSLITPIFEAPDEMAHFAYVKNLVDGQGFPALPVRTSDDSPAQESSHSPLYYSAAALVPISLMAISVAFLTRHPTALPLRKFLAGMTVTVGVFALLAGPWYLRSYLVFGDALGIAPHQLMPWARSSLLPFLDSLRELPVVLPSFWLAPGWGVIGYASTPTALQPGNELRVRLYWRAWQRPGADYTVFVHMRDKTGKTVAYGDSPPQSGAYLTSFWDAGEVVSDEHVIAHPADAAKGDYVVAVGLYRPDTGERLTIAAGADGTEVMLPRTAQVR
jgi:hypothetical protein